MTLKRFTRARNSVRFGLLVFIAILLIAFVLVGTLFYPSVFEDSRYNLGLAIRSASPYAQSFLETSVVHMLYQPYPIPRPEDWHRGLSIVLLKLWVQIFGSNETLLRIPHLLWVIGWLFLSCKIFSNIQDRQHAGSVLNRAWSIVLLCITLVFNLWGLTLLSRAYLDDLPAAVCILLLIYILIKSEKPVFWIGALCGLAFFIKGFYVTWFIIGALIITALNWGNVAKILRSIAYFCVVYSLIVIPRFLWTWHDLGEFLESPARIYNSVYSYISPALEHYPYFLYNDESYKTLALPTHIDGLVIEPYGPLQTIGNEFKKAFSSLAFAWIWVPLIILARPHRSEFAIIRLRHVLVFSVLVYVIFFLIGLGTASEARYWVMPITLTTILGNNAIHVLHSRCRAEWRKYVIAIMLVLVGANAYSAIYAFFNGTEGGTTLVSHATLLQGLSHDLNVERSALLNSREAIYYWSVDPSKRVVGLDDKYVMTLDHESAKRLFDTYDIQMALYPSHVADFLENFGFKEVCREGDWVLLQR